MRKLTILLALAISLSISADKYFEVSKQLDIFNTVYRQLEINYVDTLNYEDITTKALNSMLAALDPYTQYFKEEDNDNLKLMTKGEYAGVGALISMLKDSSIVVAKPYHGMPAQQNGLLAGDIILEVDGVKISKAKSVSETSALLKGDAGTEIKIKVLRPNTNKVIEKKFFRKIIEIDPIQYYGVLPHNPKLGYISLSEFTDKAYDHFKEALIDLQGRGIEKLVLDLRNNGGGIVDQAVNIASLFLPQGTLIVSTKGRTGQENRTYKTATDPIAPNLPIDILVNEYSASASEILSGAMQHYNKAVVYGQKTFGKGVVQSIMPLPYNSYVKITTAKYHLPNDKCVDKQNPIVPDSVLTEEEKIDIGYYLYAENIIFDFATLYHQKVKKIDTPANFKLSDKDYEWFIEYVKSRNFTYSLETDKIIKSLEKAIKIEGYSEEATAEFEALKAKLVPHIEKDLLKFRTSVEQLLSTEIIERYYYQKGAFEYSLRFDEWTSSLK